MTEKERIEENERKNKPFNTAFKFFAEYLGQGSQKKMCELMDVPSSRISEIVKNKKPVNDKLITALINLSARYKGMQIYSEYLYGNSDIMLLANVTDEEIIEVSRRKANPDYDTLKNKKNAEESTPDQSAMSSIDSSSAVNAAIAAYAQLITTKDAIIAEKEARIADLQRTITDKESIIRDREARIASLERQLASIHMSDLTNYPFAIGAAEDRKSPKL